MLLTDLTEIERTIRKHYEQAHQQIDVLDEMEKFLKDTNYRETGSRINKKKYE